MASSITKAALRSATCLSVLAAFAATNAFAQEADTAAATAPADQAATDSNAIIVTGSRIRRPELDSATPVAVIDSAQIQAQGITNVQDLTQKLPQVGISGSSRTNSNFNTTGNGVSTVNLRNLGDTRTLVLVNGRRFVGGIAGTSIVDVNNIPADFIERVDVVTGGASAVYGSDAVAGVVNFILKDNFEGITARGQYGISDRGDNRNYTGSITAGTKFGADDRGSIMGNFTYSRDAGLYSRDRKISAQDCSFICGPSAYSAFASQGRFVLRGTNPASNRAILPLAGGGTTDMFTFNPDNSVVNGFPTGYGYNRNGDRRISVPLERYLGAASAKYEVSDGITAFLEGTYAKVKSSSQIEPSPLGAGAGVANADLALGYGIDNPYIPSSIASAIAAANSDGNPANDVTSISFARRQNEVFTRSNTNSRDTFRIAGGFRGDITDKWNFEVSGVYGQVKERTATQDVDLTKYGYALDAVRDPSGNIVCRDAGARAAGCVPINLFGYNTASPAASQYVQAAIPRSDSIKNTEFVATASVNGALVTLPYGDLQIAAGVEYRREKSVDNWDELTNSGNNSGNQTPDTVGKFNVKEVFGEADVPLVKDVRFVESLSLQGAVRYSDYSTIGHVFSWNAGGEYSPVRGLRFRGNYAIANRAPNISELYSAASETFPTGIQDPCDGITATTGGGAYAAACRGIPGVAAAIGRNGSFNYTLADLQGINGFDGGNVNLQEEKGKTLTLGATVAPIQVPGLSFTADYFDIKVKGAIGIVPRQTSIQQCLLTGGSQFCGNVIRDPDTGYILTLNAQNINISTLKTRGIDFNLRYGHAVGLTSNDRVDLNLLYTRTLRYKTQSDPSAPVDSGVGNIEYGEVFKHKINGTLSYSTGPFSINWTTTYLSKMVDSPESEFDTPGTIDYLLGNGLTQEQAERAAGHNRIKARFYHDVQLKARVGENDRFEVFVGVDNLFDRKPPVLEDTLYYGVITGTTTAADVYDPYGRRFYAGAQVHF